MARTPHPALCADLSPQVRGEVTSGALRAHVKTDEPEAAFARVLPPIALPARQITHGLVQSSSQK
jgi:hypothetical protein